MGNIVYAPLFAWNKFNMIIIYIFILFMNYYINNWILVIFYSPNLRESHSFNTSLLTFLSFETLLSIVAYYDLYFLCKLFAGFIDCPNF